jgi:adenosylcobinamide kinase/adenosylcobinamide-phosphate guanylyltransferase
MIYLITGGSGSGKSAYAEAQLLLHAEQEAFTQRERKIFYIATMMPYGEDARKKIERHHELRAGKGFQTIECYQDLEDLEIPENDGILLECMSNLTANELYAPDGSMRDPEAVEQKLLEGIRHLHAQTKSLVIVTNEVNADVNGYSEETRCYQRLLGRINQALAAMAETVTEVVYGIPIIVKEDGRIC